MKLKRGTTSFRPTLEALEWRLVPATILDDPSAAFVGGWVNFTGQGYGNSVHYDAAGTGDTATWTFSGLTPGTYDVAVTWTPHPNRATGAPYSVDGGASILVNQQQAPADFNDAGVSWKDFGNFTITGSAITVVLGNAPDGYVIADAVRIAPVGGASMYFDLPNHAFHYQGDANSNTLTLTHDDGHFTATLVENGITTTISADGIYNEYVTAGLGADTITDNGTNVGVSNFFYADYELGSSVDNVTATWAEGTVGCAKFYEKCSSAAVVAFHSAGFGPGSMLTINTLTGTGGSFTFDQSGENDGRGLTLFCWNEGHNSTTTLNVDAHGNTSQYAEVVDLGTDDFASLTATVDAGDTGYLNYVVQGSQAGDDSLYASLTNNSTVGVYTELDTTHSNPNVHNNGFVVNYYS